jgi:hypothetical protein
MSHEPYIIASYALVFVGTLALIVSSFAAMRNAERKAERLSKRK